MDPIKSKLTGKVHSFIDDIAAKFEPWGMPRTVGRIYGYLLLKDSPVSVDQIASDLDVSRTGVWNGLRLLESFGHLKRFGSAGSKRALFAQSDNFAAPFQEQIALLESMSQLLHDGAAKIAKGNAAAQLKQRADFYLSMKKNFEAALKDFNAEQDPKRAIKPTQRSMQKATAK